MGRDLLLLRLEAPLQAWGLRARWDVRDTGDEPSKSGVIGLLGCALGYPVADPRLEALERQLTMAVRVERAGSRLSDYQTITGILPTAAGGVKGSLTDPSTIISPRGYLQDAAFLVIIDGPTDVLERCAAALREPRWPVYLGRKACPPSRPVLVGLLDTYESLMDALERHPWDWLGRQMVRERHPDSLRYVLERQDGAYLRPDRMRTSPGRMYATRAVHVDWVQFPGIAREDGGAQ